MVFWCCYWVFFLSYTASVAIRVCSPYPPKYSGCVDWPLCSHLQLCRFPLLSMVWKGGGEYRILWWGVSMSDCICRGCCRNRLKVVTSRNGPMVSVAMRCIGLRVEVTNSMLEWFDFSSSFSDMWHNFGYIVVHPDASLAIYPLTSLKDDVASSVI